jgi:hypothetical protein
MEEIQGGRKKEGKCKEKGGKKYAGERKEEEGNRK